VQVQFEGASVSAETHDAIERGVALLVRDHDAVRVLVTDNFEHAVRREMANHPEAESFTADRLAGVVAGKPICGGTESVIVIDGRWLQPGEDHPDPYRLLAHEGGHVALHKRAETADGRRRLVWTRAEWVLLAGAAVALEEYRIERALHRLGLAANADHWATMPATLFNFIAEFLEGLALRYRNEPITRTHDTLLGVTQQLAVKLHYLAAQDPHGELPNDPIARGLWQRFVSFTWPTLTALGATVPDASIPWPANQLDARLLQLSADRRTGLPSLGSGWSGSQPGGLLLPGAAGRRTVGVAHQRSTRRRHLLPPARRKLSRSPRASGGSPDRPPNRPGCSRRRDLASSFCTEGGSTEEELSVVRPTMSRPSLRGRP
jgi:hypothetical protein